jgi:hypothetical protein
VNTSLRPFQPVPGRDVTKDRSPGFDIGGAYYEQRNAIAEDAAVLNALIAAINSQNDLSPVQWAQWYSVVLSFAPELIVELGRAKGNSTALFCQAASRLGNTRVVSLCKSKDWHTDSLPKITQFVSREWLSRLDARLTDILEVEYAELFEHADRVLLLWDAHGFEIAEIVLGRILPMIADRPHLVLIHDISDNRYAAVPRSYEGQPLWKGARWQHVTRSRDSRINIGWMNSMQEQVIALADFATRNEVEVGSADHEYARYFCGYPDRAAEMSRVLGDRFSTAAHWAFLSLTGKEGPFHFPAVQRRYRHDCPVAMRDIYPSRWLRRSVPLPRTVETSSVPWAYASLIAFTPTATVPSGADASLRVRVRVSDGAAGLGVLSADRSEFISAARVVPKVEPETVLLPIPDLSAIGPLVVHAWDMPESARVHLEDLSIVW